MAQDRWVEVSSSPFEHEAQGLGVLRDLLPDASPFRVWSNLEFRDRDGNWFEVDALVLTRSALHVLELKSYAAPLSGTDTAWYHGGRTEDSPLLLANRKAKILKSRLADLGRDLQRRGQLPQGDLGLPYVKGSVFLHHSNADVRLPDSACTDLYVLDELATPGHGPDPISALFEEEPYRREVSRSTERTLVTLMEAMGTAVPRDREAGSWTVLAKGRVEPGTPGWQDFVVVHRATGQPGHARFASNANPQVLKLGQSLLRYEYRFLEPLRHDGVLGVLDLVQEPSLGTGIVFEHPGDLVRLDLWMDRFGESLPLSRRLEVVRRVGEVLQYAHEHGVAHRSLTPHSVWVSEPEADSPLEVKVGDWQSLGRLHAPSEGATRVQRLAVEADERQSSLLESFTAPESLVDDDADRIRLDVFALGALTCYLVAGRLPAGSAEDLRVRLREQSGLDVSIDVPEVSGVIRDAVLAATSPQPSKRTPTPRLFLEMLDRPDVTTTAPAESSLDPREAGPGAVLADGRFTVLKRLGTGSTAVGLLVEDAALPEGAPARVLKVALHESAVRRLESEASVLAGLDDPRVAGLVEGPFELGGTSALLLESAGEKTLQAELREQGGRLLVEQAESLGRDLLDALVYLESVGVDHRDIKPSNLGLQSRAKQRRRLTIFDFSASREPADVLSVGTPPFLDPFLGGRRSLYDTAAERYSVAVVLYEMLTGLRPQYGEDPTADPASVSDALVIPDGTFSGLDAEGGRMRDFFTRALARDKNDRFDTAEEMRRAWRAMFGTMTTTTEADGDELAALAELATPLVVSGLSPKALSTLGLLSRVSGTAPVTTVEEFLRLDAMRLDGLPAQLPVKNELRHRRKQWAEQLGLPQEEAPAEQSWSPTSVADSLLERSEELGQLEHELAVQVLGASDQRVDAFATQAVLGRGLSAPLSSASVMGRLKSLIVGLFDAAGPTGALLEPVTRLVDATVDELGGVAAVEELADAVAGPAPAGESAADAARRRRAAEGLLRLVVDRRRYVMGLEDREPLETRRRENVVVAVARRTELLDVAVRLGDAADRALPGSAPRVASPARTREALEPALAPLRSAGDGEDALVETLLAGMRPARLAAAMSQAAAVSSSGELYDRELPARDALALTLGGVVTDASVFTGEEIRSRVAARFPALRPLPAHGSLDELLEAAQVPLRLDADAESGRSAGGVYRSPHRTTTATRATYTETALATATASGLVPGAAPSHSWDESPSETARSLKRSRERRSYLVLGTEPRRLERAAAALVAQGAERLDVTDALVDALRAYGRTHERPSLDTLLEADASPVGSRPRRTLQSFMDKVVLPGVRDELSRLMSGEGAAPGAPLLVTGVAPLVRYGAVDALTELSDQAAARGRAVWVLVPQTERQHGAVMDGAPLSSGPNQFLDLEAEWVREHSARPGADGARVTTAAVAAGEETTA